MDTRRECALAWRVTAVVVLLLGMVSSRALASSKEDTGLLDTVLHGMDARARAMRQSIHSIKGLWTLERSSHEATKPDKKGEGEVVGSEFPWAPRMTVRTYCAVAGERYRQVERVLTPREIAWTDFTGYDGHEAWRVYGRRLNSARLKIEHLCLRELAGYPPETTEWIRSQSPRLLGTETVEGRECYVLGFTQSWTGGRAEHRLWVCPDFGYAVVRAVQRGKLEDGSSDYMEHAYGRFAGYRDGIWLPLRSEFVLKSRAPGEKEWTTRYRQQARAEYLKVNIPIPDEEFVCPEP